MLSIPKRATIPFHVVRLAGGLQRCRQRIQLAPCGHRGRRGDPLFRARRTLMTGDDLLTDRQRERLIVLFTDPNHVQVEATWSISQVMIGAQASGLYPSCPTRRCQRGHQCRPARLCRPPLQTLLGVLAGFLATD